MPFEVAIPRGLLLHVLQGGMSKGMVFVPIWFEIGYSSRGQRWDMSYCNFLGESITAMT